MGVYSQLVEKSGECHKMPSEVWGEAQAKNEFGAF